MRFKTACILAVGTELTSGQIVNSNASWLAHNLTELGIQQCWHVTVADQRESILTALEAAGQHADLLVITGGLGPTSDDFTREVVAQWLDKPLIYEPAAWSHIEARAQGLNLVSAQKQQCYFPEGARILPNPAGTAHAFVCHKDAMPVFVLPGPPNEIHAIWESSLQSCLLAYLPGRPALQLFRWQCLGLPEADIGEKVEAVLAGSLLQTGYRVHMPYVEVKLWAPPDVILEPWLRKVEAVLGPWIVARQDEEPAALLGEYLRAFPQVHVFDAGTQGNLAQRLASVLQGCEQTVKLDFWYGKNSSCPELQALLELSSTSLVLALRGGISEWQVGLRYHSQIQRVSLKPPFPASQAGRNRCWAIEKAILFWNRCLSEISSASVKAGQ